MYIFAVLIRTLIIWNLNMISLERPMLKLFLLDIFIKLD